MVMMPKPIVAVGQRCSFAREIALSRCDSRWYASEDEAGVMKRECVEQVSSKRRSEGKEEGRSRRNDAIGGGWSGRHPFIEWC